MRVKATSLSRKTDLRDAAKSVSFTATSPVEGIVLSMLYAEYFGKHLGFWAALMAGADADDSINRELNALAERSKQHYEDRLQMIEERIQSK